MRISLALAVVEQQTEKRPQQCRRCRARRFHRHRNRRRKVRDTRVERVRVVQYQCAHCQKTVTVYPKGITRAQQTQRLVMLSVTLYGLGLSYDKVKAVLQALEAKLSKGWIWHNVQEAGEQAMRAMRSQQARRCKITVLGADETEMKAKGEGTTVGFVTDPKTGQIVGMEILTSRDSEDFVRWLKTYAKRHGAKVVVTDDLDSYRLAAEEMQLEQQLCLAHFRKSVSRRLKKIEGYEEDKELVRTAVKALTGQAKRCVKRLQRRYSNHSPPRKGERESPGYKMRMLTLEILEKWNRLTLYQRGHAQKDAFARRVGPVAAVPATNNATENAIGRGGKIRYRMMRGFKTVDSMLKTTAVVATLGGVLAGVTYQSLFG